MKRLSFCCSLILSRTYVHVAGHGYVLALLWHGGEKKRERGQTVVCGLRSIRQMSPGQRGLQRSWMLLQWRHHLKERKEIADEIHLSRLICARFFTAINYFSVAAVQRSLRSREKKRKERPCGRISKGKKSVSLIAGFVSLHLSERIFVTWVGSSDRCKSITRQRKGKKGENN